MHKHCKETGRGIGIYPKYHIAYKIARKKGTDGQYKQRE